MKEKYHVLIWRQLDIDEIKVFLTSFNYNNKAFLTFLTYFLMQTLHIYLYKKQKTKSHPSINQPIISQNPLSSWPHPC
jgi:hypothetical protein